MEGMGAAGWGMGVGGSPELSAGEMLGGGGGWFRIGRAAVGGLGGGYGVENWGVTGEGMGGISGGGMGVSQWGDLRRGNYGGRVAEVRIRGI